MIHLIVLYTVVGTVALMWLFVRFLRWGSGNKSFSKSQHFFLHGLDVRRKIARDPVYFAVFLILILGLFSFVATVGFLLHRFVLHD
jgi:hypothetical protein